VEVPGAAAAARRTPESRSAADVTLREGSMSARFPSVLVLFALLALSPVAAHHSHGNYDLSQWTTMDGTVKEVHLLVPHSWLYLDVKDGKGELTTWALEATGPTGLTKVGVKREDVRPGDQVRVRCHLLKDGSNGCLLGYVTPMHGDVARGHGVEKDWDGDGGAGFNTAAPVATPR
jgi:hypothetical protein